MSSACRPEAGTRTGVKDNVEVRRAAVTNAPQHATDNASSAAQPAKPFRWWTIDGDTIRPSRAPQTATPTQPEAPFDFGDPLLNAAAYGQTEVLKALLKAGHVVDATNDQGSTALIFAAGGDPIIRLRRFHGLKVDDPYRGETNLTYIECVRLLLAHGADANRETEAIGISPLQSARSAGQSEIEAMLRDAGATNEGRWVSGYERPGPPPK